MSSKRVSVALVVALLSSLLVTIASGPAHGAEACDPFPGMPSGEKIAELGHSRNAALSTDGCTIAFQGRTNPQTFSAFGDVWVEDLRTDDLTAVSAGGGRRPSISGDGTAVVYQTEVPTNLAKDPTATRLAIHSLVDGTVVTPRVSRLQGPNYLLGAHDAVISGNGRFVAFVMPNVDNGVTVPSTIYVFDRSAGTSFASPVTFPSDYADLSISDDGRWLTYTEWTRSFTNPGSVRWDLDVHLLDLVGDYHTVLPADSLYDLPADGESVYDLTLADGDAERYAHADGPVISGDGRFVAYQVSAGYRGRNWIQSVHDDIWLYEVETGGVSLVSKNSNGVPADGNSWHPSISDDGSLVAFASGANNLAPEHPEREADVFVHAPASGRTLKVSVDEQNQEVLSWRAQNPVLSGNGRYVVFDVGENHFIRDLGDYGPHGPVGLPSSLNPIDYVAMGDSFSSGEGVEPYLPDSDSFFGGCHRSEKAFAYGVTDPDTQASIADRTSAFDFIACSGATTANVIVGGDPKHEEPAQLDQGKVTSETDLVTLSLGGNDAGLAEVLKLCSYRDVTDRIGSCVDEDFKPIDDTTYTTWLQAWVLSIDDEIQNAFEQIRSKAPNASIIVVGYPLLFPDTEEEQSCGKLGTFLGEQDFLNGIGHLLDNVVAEAAADAGVQYVDVRSHWADHEVCAEGGEWISGPVGPELGDVLDWPPTVVGTGSFHPNEEGQNAYADDVNTYIATKLANPSTILTRSGLPANPPPAPVVSPEIRTPLRRARADLRSSAQVLPAQLGSLGPLTVTPTASVPAGCLPDVRAAGQRVELNADGFAPGSAVEVTLETKDPSSIARLGPYVADGSGRLDTVARIPADTPAPSTALIQAKGAAAGGGDRLTLTTFYVGPSTPECDQAPPAIEFEPPAKSTFLLNEVVPVTGFTCTDDRGGSGLAHCSSTHAGGNLDTSTPGSHTLTIEARDHAGNTETMTWRYEVRYRFGGFRSPIENAPIVNVASAGSTVPITWVVTDALGNPVEDPSSFDSVVSRQVACEDRAQGDVVEWESSSHGLQYLGGGKWRFNWRVPSAYARTCRNVYIELTDGGHLERSAAFRFR